MARRSDLFSFLRRGDGASNASPASVSADTAGTASSPASTSADAPAASSTSSVSRRHFLSRAPAALVPGAGVSDATAAPKQLVSRETVLAGLRAQWQKMDRHRGFFEDLAPRILGDISQAAYGPKFVKAIDDDWKKYDDARQAFVRGAEDYTHDFPDNPLHWRDITGRDFDFVGSDFETRKVPGFGASDPIELTKLAPDPATLIQAGMDHDLAMASDTAALYTSGIKRAKALDKIAIKMDAAITDHVTKTGTPKHQVQQSAAVVLRGRCLHDAKLNKALYEGGDIAALEREAEQIQPAKLLEEYDRKQENRQQEALRSEREWEAKQVQEANEKTSGAFVDQGNGTFFCQLSPDQQQAQTKADFIAELIAQSLDHDFDPTVTYRLRQPTTTTDSPHCGNMTSASSPETWGNNSSATTESAPEAFKPTPGTTASIVWGITLKRQEFDVLQQELRFRPTVSKQLNLFEGIRPTGSKVSALIEGRHVEPTQTLSFKL